MLRRDVSLGLTGELPSLVAGWGFCIGSSQFPVARLLDSVCHHEPDVGQGIEELRDGVTVSRLIEYGISLRDLRLIYSGRGLNASVLAFEHEYLDLGDEQRSWCGSLMSLRATVCPTIVRLHRISRARPKAALSP